MLGLLSTVSVQPEPIPLVVKVVLIGDRLLYYLLADLDPEFFDEFKVAADFEDEIDRTSDTDVLYARLIASLAKAEQLKPLDAEAVARVVEFGARLAGDAMKVSTRTRKVASLRHVQVGGRDRRRRVDSFGERPAPNAAPRRRRGTAAGLFHVYPINIVDERNRGLDRRQCRGARSNRQFPGRKHQSAGRGPFVDAR